MKVLHTIRETPPNPSGESDNQHFVFLKPWLQTDTVTYLVYEIHPLHKNWSVNNLFLFYFTGVCAHRSVRPVHQQWQLLSGLPWQRYDRRSPGVWHSQPGRWRQVHHRMSFTVTLYSERSMHVMMLPSAWQPLFAVISHWCSCSTRAPLSIVCMCFAASG